MIRRGVEPADCAGFWAWAVAGALMSFSFLTGFSIGLVVLPFAAAALLLTARRWPHPAESLGFLAGIGATLILIGFLNTWLVSAVSPLPWLLAGTACAAFALAGYAAVRLGHR